jgi:mono/diheme cytochrome c family protein
MHLRPLVFLAVSAVSAHAATSNAALERQFSQTVKPFVTKYCVGCHSGNTPAASLDLKSYTGPDATMDGVVRDYPRWAIVHNRLAAKEMPPKPMPQPPEEMRAKVAEWIDAVRADEVKKKAGDPGPVLARRLSNAEYNYTIRDLTGVDMQPTKEFPVDPANPAGFDNSGESLTMSPALLKKYLEAARSVGDHMVLTPDGFNFAPYPMLVETDREKYAIQRILSFYFSQPTDYADYFQAAWRYKNRAALGKPNATLASVAADSKVSPKYLPLIWDILETPKDAVGPVLKLQTMWRALPAPDANQAAANQSDVLRAKCVEMRDFAVRIRKHTAMQFAAPLVKGLPAGSQPLLNWKLKQYAAHRREFDPKDLLNDTDPVPPVPVIPKYPGLHQEAAPRWAALSAKARAGDPDLIVPSAERAQYEAAFARFANVFPDVFYVTERGRYFPDDSDDKGRLLSAGYHSVVGFYRDDTPLMELVLDNKGRKQLDSLWEDFDYMAEFTARTWTQYFFNQSGEVQGHGAESASARPPDHEITDEPVIMAMEKAYLAKADAPGNDPVAMLAIKDHFDRINAALRHMETLHKESEPRQIEALLSFAARAYRRPLTKAEHDDLLAYYQTLRDKNALSHEDAIRTALVSVLMSPDFCYRFDLAPATGVSAKAAPKPLTTYELASRLSYFLWASMPDEELMRHAASGDLQKQDVLLAQARRMLKDDRINGMVTEFAGNWLDFRRFETINSVDRDRFPSFNNDLREAMFEEPIRYIADAMRNNRSALDLVYGNYTFVNPPLAKFYGMPEVKGTNDTWVKVDDASTYHRGGLLPMAVFLTQSSPGLRTSPVKRGYWVVHRVLGETIPPPPPVVPELPHDEAKSDLPIRDMLAQHRQNPVCAGCHARFDTFGLAFEGYGPVGDARTKDLAGRPVDTNATFPGGAQGSGFEGVQAWIREHRQSEFLDGLSRKLLAFALNRSPQLSDEGTLDRMNTKLAADGYKIDSLVETIVTSPQFLNKRIAAQTTSSAKPGSPQQKKSKETGE